MSCATDVNENEAIPRSKLRLFSQTLSLVQFQNLDNFSLAGIEPETSRSSLTSGHGAEMSATDARVYRRYRKEFESEFGWVQQNPDGSETAFCQICEISITPTSSCLLTHEASARHQKNVYDVKRTGQKTPAKPKEVTIPSD